MTRALYPTYVSAGITSGGHRCPLGYAPTISGGACMYCEHGVRSTCHLDLGCDDAGRTIVNRNIAPGERLTVRYAHQTSVYVGWGWVDLSACRRTLADALAGEGFMTLQQAAERVIRALPGKED